MLMSIVGAVWKCVFDLQPDAIGLCPKAADPFPKLSNLPACANSTLYLSMPEFLTHDEAGQLALSQRATSMT